MMKQSKNVSKRLVCLLIALSTLFTINYKKSILCEARAFSQQVVSNQDKLLETRSTQARSARSSPYTDEDIIPRPNTNQAPINDNSQLTITEKLNDEINFENSIADLEKLRDENPAIVTVKVSQPNKLMRVIYQLAKDIAWSAFVESYR